MTKKKRILFVALLFVFSMFFINHFFLKQTLLSLEERNQKENPAEEVTLSEGLYLVGKKIKPGFYDIFYEKGEVSFKGIRLSKGDMLLNEQIISQTEIEIEGDGKVRLKPSDFDSLKPNKNNQIVIKHSGEYVVGTDIPNGTYTFGLNGTKQITEPQIFVQIVSSFNSKDIVQSYTINSFNKQQEVNLSEGQSLYIKKINKNNEEDNDYSLIFTLK